MRPPIGLPPGMVPMLPPTKSGRFVSQPFLLQTVRLGQLTLLHVGQTHDPSGCPPGGPPIGGGAPIGGSPGGPPIPPITRPLEAPQRLQLVRLGQLRLLHTGHTQLPGGVPSATGPVAPSTFGRPQRLQFVRRGQFTLPQEGQVQLPSGWFPYSSGWPVPNWFGSTLARLAPG